MASIDKLLTKFNRKPVPNDITYSELIRIAKHYRLSVKEPNGKHPLKIAYPGIMVVPIPKHGKCVKEVYIEQIKNLIEQVKMIRGE